MGHRDLLVTRTYRPIYKPSSIGHAKRLPQGFVQVGFSSLGRPAVGCPREGKEAITPHRFGGPAGRTAANSDIERNGDLLLARRLGPPHHIRQGGTTWTASE